MGRLKGKFLIKNLLFLSHLWISASFDLVDCTCESCPTHVFSFSGFHLSKAAPRSCLIVGLRPIWRRFWYINLLLVLWLKPFFWSMSQIKLILLCSRCIHTYKLNTYANVKVYLYIQNVWLLENRCSEGVFHKLSWIKYVKGQGLGKCQHYKKFT